MLELAKAAQPVTRSEMSRDEAVALFKEKGEDYKVQILKAFRAMKSFLLSAG